MASRFIRKTSIAAAVLLTLAVSSASATTYLFDTSATTRIDRFTGFATLGSEMDGMHVTATFSGGVSEMLVWADTDAVSGGVFGAGWSLSQSGDTFVGQDRATVGRWNFANETGLSLLSLVLDGNTALTGGRTVSFDVDTYDVCKYSGAVEDDQCSPGSARGDRLRFHTDVATLDGIATVTYSDVVRVGGALPLGDVFHLWTLDLAGGYAGSFQFDQDTDTGIVFLTPEPASLALLGLGLVGLGLGRRRKVS